jgi:hypothetical protein
MKFAGILRQVDAYYTARLRQHGATARGVDWNSAESQALRFRQLLRICPGEAEFSLNDFGCGYGALLDYVHTQEIPCRYHGFDVSAEMIEKARALHDGIADASFTTDTGALSAADYTLSSGVFNVKQCVNRAAWEEYVLSTLDVIATLSQRGFAFNLLTSHADPERMRDDLYYADPCFFFEHCRRGFSRHVALLHDYGLYEFTILVRK